MNISKTQIMIFFVIVFLMIVFLYPRAFYMGRIYEGHLELEKAEQYYLNTLAKNPMNKKASVQLAHLYEKMATPEKAIPILEVLLKNRVLDWSLAKEYLTYVSYLGDPQYLFLARDKVIRQFVNSAKYSKFEMKEILDLNLRQALWMQKINEAEYYLDILIQETEANSDYIYLKQQILLASHDSKKIIDLYKDLLQQNPDRDDLRSDYIAVLILLKEYQTALEELNKIQLKPENRVIYLEQKYSILRSLHRNKDAIAVLINLIEGLDSDSKEKLRYSLELASIYQGEKQYQESLKILLDLLETHQDDKSLWKELFAIPSQYFYEGDYLKYLEKYLLLFPSDEEMERYLIEQFLYVRKDFTRLDYYLTFIQKYSDEKIALEIAYHFSDSKNLVQAIQWLNQVQKLFPDSIKIFELRLNLFLEIKNYAAIIDLLASKKNKSINDTLLLSIAYEEIKDYLKAIRVLESIDGYISKNPEQLERLAYLYYSNGQKNKAIQTWIKLGEMPTLRFERIFLVGRELFFLNQYHGAKKYLLTAQKIKANDARVYYYLSEIAWAWQKKNEYKKWAQEVLKYNLSEQDPELIRQRYKVLGRLSSPKDLKTIYGQVLQGMKQDQGMWEDYIVLLLEKGVVQTADLEIEKYRKNFPKEEKNYSHFKSSLFLKKEDYHKAISLLRSDMKKYPEDPSYALDLSYAYLQNKEWIKAKEIAVRNYDLDPIRNQKMIQEIRKIYRPHVDLEFTLLDLGADESMKWSLNYEQYIKESLKLNLKSQFARIQDQSINSQDEVYEFESSLTYSPNFHWDLSLGLDYAHSDLRDALSPSFSVTYRPKSFLSLNVSAQYRVLRQDVARAILEGALQDQLGVSMEYQFKEKLYFRLNYELAKTSLSGGAKAYEQIFNPSLEWVFLRKPFLSLAYNYSYGKVYDQGLFLSRLNLIPEYSAHLLSLNFSHHFKDKLFFDTSVYLGGDDIRGIRPWLGENFGINSGIKWNLNTWLDLKVRYNYAKESLLGLSGDSHFVQFGLSGYWDTPKTGRYYGQKDSHH